MGYRPLPAPLIPRAPGAPRMWRRSKQCQTRGMATYPSELSPASVEFMAERHPATLTTLRADGSPHVVPVGFTWDGDTLVARVIASRSSAKVRQGRAGPGAGAIPGGGRPG